jgi:hypothetical protein
MCWLHASAIDPCIPPCIEPVLPVVSLLVLEPEAPGVALPLVSAALLLRLVPAVLLVPVLPVPAPDVELEPP